jgi:hypothetical protein
MQDQITKLNAAQNQLASQIQMSKAVDQMQAEDDIEGWFKSQIDGVEMRCNML